MKTLVRSTLTSIISLVALSAGIATTAACGGLGVRASLGSCSGADDQSRGQETIGGKKCACAMRGACSDAADGPANGCDVR